MTAALLLAVACSAGSGDASPAASATASEQTSGVAPDVGARAPEFSAQIVDGDVVTLASLRGKGLILNFWATWCAPCQRELPLLETVAAERSGDGVEVIAVDMGEPENEVRTYINNLGLKLPVALDTDGLISRSYFVPALPMTFFIDGDGVVRYRRVGELSDRHITEGLAAVGIADAGAATP